MDMGGDTDYEPQYTQTQTQIKKVQFEKKPMPTVPSKQKHDPYSDILKKKKMKMSADESIIQNDSTVSINKKQRLSDVSVLTRSKEVIAKEVIHELVYEQLYIIQS